LIFGRLVSKVAWSSWNIPNPTPYSR
jgi:hypothetical protein